MSDKPNSLLRGLNGLGVSLEFLGVNEMPEIVFSDPFDWLNIASEVSSLTPYSEHPDPHSRELSGFRLSYQRSPVDEASRFVDEEIGT